MAGRVQGADERLHAEITGILPSAPWLEEIRSAIAAADTVMVLVSPDSCASPVCRTELDYAAELNKRLIPVLVRDTPATALPEVLAPLQWFHLGPVDNVEAAADRLVEILDTDIEGLHLHTWLSVRSREWDSDSQDGSRLLRGKELTNAEHWLATQSSRKPAPTMTQTAYIFASRAAATRRQRVLIVTAAALVLIMGALTAIAGIEWRSAVTQSNTATSRALALQSESFDSYDPVLASQLGAAAWSIAQTPQARVALLDALAQPQRAVYNANAADENAVAFSGNGRLVAAASLDQKIRLWNVATRQEVKILTGNSAAGIGAVQQVAFSPDGKILAAVDIGGPVRLWNLAAPHPVVQKLAGSGIAFSPNGRLFAIASGGVVHLRDIATGRLAGRSLPGSAVAFSPDGAVIATADSSGGVRLWNASTLAPVGRPLGQR